MHKESMRGLKELASVFVCLLLVSMASSSASASGVAPLSTTDSISPLQPIEDLRALAAELSSMPIQHGIKNALKVKLQNLIERLESVFASRGLEQAVGLLRSTNGELGAFINHVQAQRGKQIRTSDADELVATAQHINGRIELLGQHLLEVRQLVRETLQLQREVAGRARVIERHLRDIDRHIARLERLTGNPYHGNGWNGYNGNRNGWNGYNDRDGYNGWNRYEPEYPEYPEYSEYPEWPEYPEYPEEWYPPEEEYPEPEYPEEWYPPEEEYPEPEYPEPWYPEYPEPEYPEPDYPDWPELGYFEDAFFEDVVDEADYWIDRIDYYLEEPDYDAYFEYLERERDHFERAREYIEREVDELIDALYQIHANWGRAAAIFKDWGHESWAEWAGRYEAYFEKTIDRYLSDPVMYDCEWVLSRIRKVYPEFEV